MKKIYYSIYQTKIAPFFYFYSSSKILLGCFWITDKMDIQRLKKENELKKSIFFEKRLNKYFKKKLQKFNIHLNDYKYNYFTNNVLNTINNIPYGSVLTYKEIAQKLNKPFASRAVGQACKKNRFPLIIPCHRVVAKNGYGGYMGKMRDGIKIRIKKSLLELENIRL